MLAPHALTLNDQRIPTVCGMLENLLDKIHICKEDQRCAVDVGNDENIDVDCGTFVRTLCT